MSKTMEKGLHRSATHQAGGALAVVLAALAGSVVLFLIGYAGAQLYLANEYNQRDVARLVGSAHQNLCNAGIRLPDMECREPRMLVGDLVEERPSEPLAKAFARMPDLSAVVRKLRWNNGSEADAARFLAVVRNVALARNNQARGNSEAMKKLAPKMAPLWQDYPDLVVASACVYCGSHTRLLEQLIEAADEHEGADLEKLKSSLSGHPRLFRLANEQMPFDPEHQYRLARIHAELGGAGDSSTADLIAGILVENQDYDRLKLWADSGLNGGRSLSELDLSTLSRELVETAWRQGVSMAYDDFTLTQFLFKQGYRPALRWVVWLQSSNLPYVQDYQYSRFADKYQALIDHHTEFDAKSGAALAQFYSENWRRIFWDPSSEAWRYE